MSKSFVELEDEIMSVLLKYKQEEMARLDEPAYQIQKSRNIDLGNGSDNDCLPLISALEAIVSKNKRGFIHSDYSEDLKALEPILRKLRADEMLVQTLNGNMDIRRNMVSQEIAAERDEVIGKLTDNRCFYEVAVNEDFLTGGELNEIASHLSELGFVKNDSYRGFDGIDVVVFGGFYDGEYKSLSEQVKSFVPSGAVRNFADNHIRIYEESIGKSLAKKVEDMIDRPKRLKI